MGVGVVVVGVATTVDGDIGSGEFFEVGAGLVGDAGVVDGVAADYELEDVGVVEDARGDWNVGHRQHRRLSTLIPPSERGVKVPLHVYPGWSSRPHTRGISSSSLKTELQCEGSSLRLMTSH